MVQFFDPTQEAEIKRRRRIAEQLQAQGAPRQTEMVSGFAVPQSGLEQLARGLSSGVGAYQAATADTKEQDLAKQRQELLAQALGKVGTDQREAGTILAQDPSMLSAGIGLIKDANETDRELLKFERDANLRREIAGIQQGMKLDPDTGELVPNPNAPKGQPKPLPVGALNLQDEITNSLATASNLTNDASAMAAKIRAGQVPLEPTGKIEAFGRNQLGLSDEKSRAYGDYKTFVEKVRNDSLRLNKGVQTEGDAQRALNELTSAGNDKELIASAMDKIANINARAVQLQKARLNNLRSNYGLPELDTSTLTPPPAAPAGMPEGARQAKDGNYYIPDPQRPGKYLKVN